MVELTGSELLGLVAAAALIVLGAVLLRLGRRSHPAMFLGAFAALWGLQGLTVRLWQVTDRGVPELLLASQVFVLPLYVFLAHFAATYPTRLRFSTRWWWPWLLAAPAVAVFALGALDRSSLLNPGVDTVWGWATLLLLFLPLLASLVFALVRFAASEDQGPQFRLCTMALLAYLAYFVVYLATGLSPEVAARLGPGLPLYSGAVVGAAVAVAGSAAVHLRRHWREPLSWALVVVPVLSGLLANPSTNSDLTGLWRVVTVVLLFYAVARYSLFDLELRLKRTAGWVLAGIAGLVAAGTLAIVLQRLAPGTGAVEMTTMTLGSGLLVTVGAVRPAAMLLDRQFPRIRADEEYLRRRKYEVYRAAILGGAAPAQLTRLGRELKLRPSERTTLEAAFLPPRDPGQAQGLLGARYEVHRELGGGAQGRLLLARDRRLGDPVVLKEFASLGRRGSATTFAREAKALGAIRHRNVIGVRDVFHTEEAMYVVMDHAEGGNLEQRLGSGRRMPLEEALDLAGQLLEGLAAAHARGIVHRDVKPSNILFHGGVAKLADFGVALDPVMEAALRVGQGQPGTVGWMAPEQALGLGASPASDVYAVGAVLYRMLAGRHYIALDGLGADAARRAVARRRPRLPIPGVPEVVNQALARALAKDPAQRYPDARAMLRDLRRAQRRMPRAPARGSGAAGRPARGADPQRS